MFSSFKSTKIIFTTKSTTTDLEDKDVTIYKCNSKTYKIVKNADGSRDVYECTSKGKKRKLNMKESAKVLSQYNESISEVNSELNEMKQSANKTIDETRQTMNDMMSDMSKMIDDSFSELKGIL